MALGAHVYGKVKSLHRHVFKLKLSFVALQVNYSGGWFVGLRIGYYIQHRPRLPILTKFLYRR